MDFKLNDEQELLRDTIREFAESEIAPRAAELDEEEKFPADMIPMLGEIGIMGIPIAEEYGGVGMKNLENVMAVEEISKACASTGITVAIHSSLCCLPIQTFGTEEQKEKYLPDLASGEKLGAFALTEPNAGSDAANQSSTAKDMGDYYLLNGSKIFITNGSYADVYLVFAAMDKSAGHHGISAFILEKGMEGFTFGSKEKKMGIRGSATYELVFDNVKVPKENLLGKAGEGFQIAMAALDGGRIAIAAQALGIAEGALATAGDYVKERVQFGQPISSFQNTQFTLADMKTKVEAARYLVYHAACKLDDGEKCSEDAAMAKLYASRMAQKVTRKAVQLLGGYGYTREYPVERMMRDAKITEIYGGTSEVQKMIIASHMGVK